MRTLLTIAALLTLVVRPAAAQTVPLVLGGVDVYRSAALTREHVLREHGSRLDSLAAAFGRGDYGAARPHYEAVVESVRARGDVVHLDIGVTTAFDEGRNTLYLMIDVVERADSAARLSFAPAPTIELDDPAGVLAQWDAYLERAFALMQARALDPAVQDCPALHCVAGFAHPELEPYRALFDSAATHHRAELVRVLREDARSERRAAAAFVLAHAGDAAGLVQLLTPALRDPHGEVRNNALRVIAQVLQADARLEVPVEDLLRALDDPSSSVRNKAALAVSFVADRPEYRSAILRHGDVLLRLLRLQQENNHSPAWAILRALSGRSYDARDYDSWAEFLRDARGAGGSR